MASDTPSRMSHLAQVIATETSKLESYFKTAGLPVPSFDIDSDPFYYLKLPSDIWSSRQSVIDATKELRDLVLGPREVVRWTAWRPGLEALSLGAINHYNIAKLFPLEETISLVELQKRSRLDPVNLNRLVRFGMSNSVFREVAPGTIAHTAASRVLAEDEDMQHWITFNTEYIFPAAAHVLPALEKYPEAMHPTQTGFNFAFGTVDVEPMFVTFGKDPVKAKMMGRAMASMKAVEGYETKFLVDGYEDFAGVDERGGVFVDIGGSHGFVCVDIAKKFKKMRFVVQDLPKTVETAPKPIDEDAQVAERISFQAHDFFTEQTVKDADIYFFRWILHNYSTPYALKLLRNLIPALKPGARILINDQVLPDMGTENPWDEGIMRGMDIVMLALLNAQERTAEEFKNLFELADPGFVFKGIIRPPGSRMSVIEAVWKPDEA